jgi:hypothetical protein
MSREPSDVLKRAASIPGKGPDVAAAMRRGETLKRQRYASIAGVALLIVGGLTLGATALSRNTAAPAPPSSRVRRLGFVTYRGRHPTFSVRYPSTWYRAKHALVPNVGSPHELFSIATRPLRWRKTNCGHLPKSAFQDLSSKDAFVSVYEQAGPPTGFGRRPADFRTVARPTRRFDCMPRHRHSPIRYSWLLFRDHGRNFYALVVIGTRASGTVKDQAWAALNSFSTTDTPNKPGTCVACEYIPPDTKNARRFGPAMCSQPSAVAVRRPGFVDVTPVVKGGRARAVVMEGRPFPAHADIKIVWRLTGSGPLKLFATGHGSKRIRPPQFAKHSLPGLTGSGDEWGSVFRFPAAGCYVLHAQRSHTKAYIKLLIR